MISDHSAAGHKPIQSEGGYLKLFSIQLILVFLHGAMANPTLIRKDTCYLCQVFLIKKLLC